jgi:hypothetical protein
MPFIVELPGSMRGHKSPLFAPPPQEKLPMKDIHLRDASTEELALVQEALAAAILPATLSFDQALIQMAELPFYADFKFYELLDLRLPGSNSHRVLARPGQAVLLDGGAESLVQANELAQLMLDHNTAPSYVRFFYAMLGDSPGGFRLVEEVGDIPWLPEADQKEQEEVADHVQTLTVQGIEDNGMVILSGTALFRGDLFSTRFLAASRAVEVRVEDVDEPLQLPIGGVMADQPEILREDLSVTVNDQAVEFDHDDGADANSLPSALPYYVYKGLPRIDGIEFLDPGPDHTQELLDLIPESIRPDIEDGIQVRLAKLPFYEHFELCAFVDPVTDPPLVRYLLMGPESCALMDATNEAIYATNTMAPIILNPETLIPYAKLFFYLVRGQLGRFILVEKPDEVEWLPEATAKEKAEVNARLMPVTNQGIDTDGLLSLRASFVFNNALFYSDIKIAPREMDVPEPETGESSPYSIGQMLLANEELLLEDLHVPVDPPPWQYISSVRDAEEDEDVDDEEEGKQ